MPTAAVILLGNGDGSFKPAQTFTAGRAPLSVAVGDFNGDGLPDIVVANSLSGNVSVLLGNGDGSFQDARNFAVLNGVNLTSVAVGDVNGDGVLDVVVGHGSEYYGDGCVSVLLGNGDGSFQRYRCADAGGGPRSVAMGDFNGDGLLDLAVADIGAYHGGSAPGVKVLLGNGDGFFRTAQNLPVLGWSVTVGDFNGDGIPDLAVANPGNGTLSVSLGNGDGSFLAPVSYAAGGGPIAVATADFNGDGWSDLAVANNYSSDVSILLNDGRWSNPRPGPGAGVPGGGRAAAAILRPRASPTHPSLPARELRPFDPTTAAVLPPFATIVPVSSSRPSLRADVDQGSARAAPAGKSAVLPAAPVPVGARSVAPAQGLLDRLFVEPISGWLWQFPAEESSLPGL